MSEYEGKSIKQIVDEIIADGKLTQSEQAYLQRAMMSDGTLDADEKEQIKRLMDMLTDGELEVVPGE